MSNGFSHQMGSDHVTYGMTPESFHRLHDHCPSYQPSSQRIQYQENSSPLKIIINSYMGLAARKVFDKVIFKSACSATETS